MTDQAGHTWQPVGLETILNGKPADPSPALLTRDDERRLLYAGKVHSISGESESLKTWLVLVGCAEEILAERHVLFVDFEDSPDAIVARLLALGCPREAILTYFHYVRPHEPFGKDAAKILKRALETPPSLAVVDGVTEAMGIHQLDPLSNADVAAFIARLPRVLANGGAAVALIDHVTKARDGRGRYATGAQHKLAAIDGAAYIVELLRPFGHGQHGMAKIVIAKDRPGRVREHSAGKSAALLHLHSEPDGSVLAALQPPRTFTEPREGGAGFRPTVLMERISLYVEEHPRLSGRAIVAAVSGNTEHKRLALELLISEGYVAVTRVGNSNLHEVIKPYRTEEQHDEEDDDHDEM